MSAGQQTGAKQNNSGASGQQGSTPADWDRLKDDVSDIADAALDRGRGLLGSAREQATGFLDQRKDDVAQSVQELAQSLRETTEGFADRPNLHGIVDSAVGGLEQLADQIRERSVADLFNDLETIMRRRPMTVAVATLAAGFLAARFVKASAEGMRDDHARQSRQPQRLGNQSGATRTPGSSGAQAQT
jgi:hypothetical protein